MVRQGWEWNSLSTTISIPYVFFESRMVTISAPVGPYVSPQNGEWLDWFKQFTSAWPFQCLTISIINGQRRLRLVSGLWNGRHNLFLSHGQGQSWLGLCPIFTPRLSDFGLDHAIHISSTLPISHHWYNKWLSNVGNGIHCPQSSAQPNFWVKDGDNFGSRPLRFIPKWRMIGLIQAIHISLTLPMSHH